MKINVALFITALSTAGRRHGVLPVVSAASAAAGDDGAAAATTTTVDRPHLRALLQNEDFLEVAGCPAAGWNAEACPADYCADCNGKTHCQYRFIPCPQDNSICVPERNYLLCCNANGNNCNGEFPDKEDAVMIIPQDTDRLDASSPLRASLLKVE